jgi:beta-barrel assembly-enhancing protease
MTQTSYFKTLILLLSISLALPLMSQHKINYAPLRCYGEIPKDFLQLSSEKVLNDKKKISQSKLSRRERELEKDFALNSNFGVDEILYSGKVLYGDALSVYINHVADKILENDHKLRSQLRFYVLKTSSVNAFSTSQGIIFVSVGLISQVENEAQLAFVLCHEIAHFAKKHSIESYKRKMDIISGKGKFKQLDFEARLKGIYSYSKENEMDADEEGLKLYLKTSYYTSAVLSSFDMLLYSYLPYDEIEWNASEFQDSFYKFPQYYTPEKGKEISADEAEDDEESTHPNVRKRKAEIEKLLDEEAPPKGNTFYLMGEEYFNQIQQQSRIELFFILINNAQYEKAYYLSYLYKHLYKDTAYASKIAGFCIYAKSAKLLSTKESSSIEVDDEVSKLKEEGEFYNVAFFFDKMGKDELAVLSVRTAWDAYLRNNKSDSFYRVIFEESAKNLFKYTDYTLPKFYEGFDTTKKVDSVKNVSEQNDENLSKVEKLKKKQKKQAKAEIKDVETRESKMYFRYAFIEFFKDPFFKKTLEHAYAAHKDKDDEDESYAYNYKKVKKWHKKYGYPGNIDSLILMNPYFSRVFIGNKEDKKDLLYDERQEIILANLYLEMARLNDINVEPLNLFDKKNLTTEKMNEYAQIMEWMSERLNNFSSDVKLFNTQYISDVVVAKGTSKLCLSGISYVIEGQEFDALTMIFCIIVYPLLPYYLAYQLQKIHYFNLTTVIFDLETGKLVYLTSDQLRIKYRKTDYVSSQIFAIFNQLKRRAQ